MLGDVSAVDLVEDLIELEVLAEHETDADRRRRLLNLANRVARREGGAKVSEAAQILDVSAPTVRAWVEAGVLTAVAHQTPLRVELSSLAAAKRAVDEVRLIKDDPHLLADVYRVLRDRAALDRADVGEGIADLRAGRTIELTPDVLDELLPPPNDRMLTAWPAPDHAIVLAIGPHNRSNTDVYELLLAAQDLEVPDDERTKPPCCDTAGEPPADSDAATAIIEALDGLARRRRRQRGSTRHPLRV
jgi:hypothetical protein